MFLLPLLGLPLLCVVRLVLLLLLPLHVCQRAAMELRLVEVQLLRLLVQLLPPLQRLRTLGVHPLPVPVPVEELLPQCEALPL